MSLKALVMNQTTPVPFSVLPRPAQKALIQYGALEASCYYSDVLLDFLSRTLTGPEHILTEQEWDTAISLVSAKRLEDGEEEMFYFAELDTASVCDAITSMKPDFLQEYDSFEAYHQWYISNGGAPDYPETDRYPVLAWCDEEGIMDGWHRFHSYLRSKHKTIPLVY